MKKTISDIFWEYIILWMTLALLILFFGAGYINKRAGVESCDYPDKTNYAIIVVDSCEYLLYNVELEAAYAYNKYSYTAKFMTHKGNCKSCEQRNK